MTIIQGIQQRPLHHDYKPTQTLLVITIDSFQTSVMCKMLKVVHGNQSDNHCNWSDKPSIPLLYIYYTVLQRFSLPCLACIHMHTRDITNITRTLLLCCTFKLLLLFVRTGQTKSQPTVWPIIDFLPVYADLNWYNTRNYQWMQTLTTLQ